MKKLLLSPILESKLILLTAIIVWIAVFLSIFTAYFSTSSTIDDRSVTLSKIELALIGIFYISMTFAFMLPNFKPSYSDILQLTIIVAINITLSFMLYFTVEVKLTSNGFLRTTLPLISAGLFIISTTIFLYYFFHRLFEVKRITSQDDTSLISIKEMTIIVSIAILSLFTIIPTFRVQGINNIFEMDLPGHSFLVPFAFIFMISAYYIRKDQSYPFIIPVTLYGIIITERETGLTILTQDYQTEIPAIELLGNLFTALDISLQETVKSTKTIEDIIFGDKVIHIASGSLISTILIVSKNSLITKSLAKYATREFEKRYSNLFGPTKVLNQADFKGFEEIFLEIRTYLAL